MAAHKFTEEELRKAFAPFAEKMFKRHSSSETVYATYIKQLVGLEYDQLVTKMPRARKTSAECRMLDAIKEDLRGRADDMEGNVTMTPVVKHNPVLDEGEITEIENAFKYSDERSMKVATEMRDEGAARSASDIEMGVLNNHIKMVEFVVKRHAEIIQHLRNDRNNIPRKRWD